ncbi:MAG: CDP-glycerol glycerophosphotransferase family protein [Desulfuromonadales bacterium]|nr:CDP-glycerol glycerophosphotransferase family protein [Desulfuromonadales bacterium]
MSRKILLFASQVYSLTILRPLQSAALERGDEVAWYYYHPSACAPYRRPRERLLETVEEVISFNADAVMVASNVVPDFFPGIKVQLFHGFDALKRPAHRGFQRVRGFFDLYCTHGPTVTEVFKPLADTHGHFAVVETGWCKLDPLFRPGSDLSAAADDRPTVLITSTFTPSLSLAVPLHDAIRKLAESGRWRVLVTMHPKMAPETVARYRNLQNENLTFVDTDDIVPLLQQADVMVSDTSSVIFEFLLLGKPVVTFRNRRPGPWLYDIDDPEQLEPAIRHVLDNPDAFMAEIERLGAELHPCRDGHSSERVLQAVDRFIDERWSDRLRRKPLNLVRRLKIRRELHYPLCKGLFS